MKGLIALISLIMFLLVWNIFGYVFSEKYRTFIKEVKYHSWQHDTEYEISDELEYKLIEKTGKNGEKEIETQKVKNTDLTFLHMFSSHDSALKDTSKELRDLFRDEQFVLEAFQKRFVLAEKTDISDFDVILDVMDEYPDAYREYSGGQAKLYMFPTKSYDDVKNIFEVLAKESKYSVNATNSFGQRSFFVNLNTPDDAVRMVFEYKNLAFGLKIKKAEYNTIKTIFETF